MIRPPGWGGAAFSESSDGDVRFDPTARRSFSNALHIEPDWATVRQVHGDRVKEATSPGDLGEADAIWTRRAGLPIAVFTADCFAVVVSASDAIGVAHAGWRGADAGVVTHLVETMADSGHRPRRVAIGPGIGPCCFEVGPEVAMRFPGAHRETAWGTQSVDLLEYLKSGLPELEVWADGGCTMHEPGWFSHRGTGTTQRMAAVAWI